MPEDETNDTRSKSPELLTKSMTLNLTSDNLYHNSEITVDGCPDPKELPCIVKWYDHDLNLIFQSSKSLIFQPNVQDAGRKIYCQWYPADEGDEETSTLLPSKLAEIGPLKRNPALVTDAQAILDKGRGEFDIILPTLSKTEKQKLVYVAMVIYGITPPLSCFITYYI